MWTSSRDLCPRDGALPRIIRGTDANCLCPKVSSFTPSSKPPLTVFFYYCYTFSPTSQFAAYLRKKTHRAITLCHRRRAGKPLQNLMHSQDHLRGADVGSNSCLRAACHRWRPRPAELLAAAGCFQTGLRRASLRWTASDLTAAAAVRPGSAGSRLLTP